MKARCPNCSEFKEEHSFCDECNKVLEDSKDVTAEFKYLVVESGTVTAGFYDLEDCNEFCLLMVRKFKNYGDEYGVVEL